jgi:murein DD-endopeptidase MepM/ murein hydrolase activator NlpD
MFFKLGLGALAALVMTATPAQANEAAATTAQITGAVAPQSATGDREFSELFASWKSIDTTGGIVAAAPSIAAVSVPAGMPLHDATLTSDYGMRTHPVLGGRRNHKGVDLAQPTGTPVYATADGIVSRAEAFSSYGNYIQIEHGGELQTRFGHLSGFAVVAGEQVRKGQLIGYVGSTGRSTGPHLHYEVRVAGEAVDPRPYMVATDLAVAPSASLGRGGPE